MASDINDTVTEIEMEAIKKDLLRKSTKGEWDGVIDIYQKHPSAHKAKLTQNEDTALHIAVSDNKQAEKVGRLMDIISCYHGDGKDQAHEFKNKRGNTPLHVAASLGSVTMCESIARSFPLGLSFMAARNCKGETPLFLAALSGKKDALVSLHTLCQDKNLNGYDISWRTDDYDTILHVAISIECFDMALEIIKSYPKLVHSTNRKGLSPLHLLAGKPSAFKSCATISEDVSYSNYKRSKKKGGEMEDLENPQIRSSPRQDQHRGFPRIKSMKRGIQDQENAAKVMNELVERTYERADHGGTVPNKTIRSPEMAEDPKQKTPIIGSTSGKGEAPILIATKNGITEMVEKILEISPEAVYEVDSNMKNIVLLSVEHKQPDIYELLLDKKKKNIIHDTVFWEVDNDGNTALHLAAKVENSNLWPVAGPAFQMNWEIKWFEYVQKSMPESYPFLCNKAGETPAEVFTNAHELLVEEGRKWLIEISNLACPIATGVFVAIAFSSTPKLDVQINETNSQKKMKLLQYSYLTIVYSFSYCLSTTAVLCFLLIISSRYSERSFGGGITSAFTVFIFGLAFVYLSVICTAGSFLYGHFSLSNLETASSLHTCLIVLMPLFILVMIIPLLMYIRLAWKYMTMPHRNVALYLSRFRVRADEKGDRGLSGWRLAWSRWTK